MTQQTPQVQYLEIDDEELAGQRLDNYLTKKYKANNKATIIANPKKLDDFGI